jgi:hypothetical protein
MKQLAGILSDIGVDQRARVTSGDGEFTWILEPSERLEE